jgi:hypothetical protein
LAIRPAGAQAMVVRHLTGPAGQMIPVGNSWAFPADSPHCGMIEIVILHVLAMQTPIVSLGVPWEYVLTCSAIVRAVFAWL